MILQKYWDTSNRNTWDKVSPPPGEVLTPWRPFTHFCVTFVSLWVTLHQPAWGLHLQWCCLPTLPSALSLECPASPPPQSLTVAHPLLFLHPTTLPLKSNSSSLRIDFPQVTEYLPGVSPNDSQVFSYTFPVDESTTEIKSLISG